MERTDASSILKLGTSLPNFSLKSVNNEIIDAHNYFKGARAALIIFTCNHCPYVKGSEDALNNAIKEHLTEGLMVLAINSNDATKYPEDSFEKMQEKSLQLRLPYPYLYDESQQVARLFDAACTPECYLFDANFKLVFHGTINDNPRDSSRASRGYLSEAIKQILAKQQPEPSFVHPIGCSIKWK